MMSVRVRQKRSAPSRPSRSSFSWKMGRNSFMLVLPLMFRSTRQITNITPVIDMANIGNAKYHSLAMNLPNASMRRLPGDRVALGSGSACGGKRTPALSFLYTEKAAFSMAFSDERPAQLLDVEQPARQRRHEAARNPRRRL